MIHEGWDQATAYAVEDEPRVYTVSQLNAQIKALLESSYRFIWVKGEVSNLRMPASGHCYFTLKDQGSQLRTVMFRLHQRNLRFHLEDGLEVLCQGRISVYEPRGDYQLIVETIEPQGLGALQLAFEQLKKKLHAEGLFEQARKLPLPIRPQHLVVITSSTGAAIRDILKVLKRSPYPLTISLLPVRVQGQEAAGEIAAAIEAANKLVDRFAWNLLIVGRGGGSIEDLWPFNEEIVARSVAASAIPVISAVGHEIDLTISDLAADLRAPTPTAAAEWVVSRLESLQRDLERYQGDLQQRITQQLSHCRQVVGFLEKRLIDPRKRLEDLHLLVDDKLDRMQLALLRSLEKLRLRHRHLGEKLSFYNPQREIRQNRALLLQYLRSLRYCQQNILERSRLQVQRIASKLESLSPLQVLARGYSITYRARDRKVVRDAIEVQCGEAVTVQLAKGSLQCSVNKIDTDSNPAVTVRPRRGDE